jgi:hypothetical protein
MTKKMTKPSYVVARLVMRKDGLAIIGKGFPGQKALKPNRIYQIEEWLGEIVVRDLGPSIIQDETVYPGSPHWGHDFNFIFERCKEFIMTKIEYISAFVVGDEK